MRTHSSFGGRHELGQNFLHSHRTIRTIASLTEATTGPILEIGPGTGAVTAQLYRLGRPLTLVELDETRINHLEHEFPRAQVRHADALSTPFDAPVIVGNIPFHLTTPILRKLLRARAWRSAILLTQWEVARKRAGVGGSTMLTAQWAPWYDFRLIERVPAHAFTPRPSVDGGLLAIDRMTPGLLPARQRSDYQQFVRTAFTGRGRGMKGILTQMDLTDRHSLKSVMEKNEIEGDTLPRDLAPDQWAGLYSALAPKARSNAESNMKKSNTKSTTNKEMTMRNDKTAQKNGTNPVAGEKVLDPSAFGHLPPITGEIPLVAEKPVITGEIPIVGADAAAKGVHAPVPGLGATAKSHDKAHSNPERGFTPQHKKAQPQPRWNLPRRQG